MPSPGLALTNARPRVRNLHLTCDLVGHNRGSPSIARARPVRGSATRSSATATEISSHGSWSCGACPRSTSQRPIELSPRGPLGIREIMPWRTDPLPAAWSRDPARRAARYRWIGAQVPDTGTKAASMLRMGLGEGARRPARRRSHIPARSRPTRSTPASDRQAPALCDPATGQLPALASPAPASPPPPSAQPAGVTGWISTGSGQIRYASSGAGSGLFASARAGSAPRSARASRSHRTARSSASSAPRTSSSSSSSVRLARSRA